MSQAAKTPIGPKEELAGQKITYQMALNELSVMEGLGQNVYERLERDLQAGGLGLTLVALKTLKGLEGLLSLLKKPWPWQTTFYTLNSLPAWSITPEAMQILLPCPATEAGGQQASLLRKLVRQALQYYMENGLYLCLGNLMKQNMWSDEQKQIILEVVEPRSGMMGKFVKKIFIMEETELPLSAWQTGSLAGPYHGEANLLTWLVLQVLAQKTATASGEICYGTYLGLLEQSGLDNELAERWMEHLKAGRQGAGSARGDGKNLLRLLALLEERILKSGRVVGGTGEGKQKIL